MTELTPRGKALQALIGEFISNRIVTKEKQDKTPADAPERISLKTQVDIAEWLAKAIKILRSQKKNPLRLATHPIKATHPDAESSSFYASPSSLPGRSEIGSHCLMHGQVDAVGNAATLGIYRFLMEEFCGESVLSLLQKSDQDLLAAFGVDHSLAEEWRVEFCKVLHREERPRSSTLAKQVYWQVSPDEFPPDANDNSHYHLLSTLNSSAVSHWLYGRIQEHRFGEEAKAARQARRAGADHPQGYHDYPQLAEEKKGGTKPQNISQLNSERRGSNYLLASLPPQWNSAEIRPLYRQDSLFIRFGQQREVRRLLRELREYLGKLKPEQNNMHIKNRRDVYLTDLFAELLQFGAAFSHTLPAGWTADPDCRLPPEEQCWLDPYRAETDLEFNKIFQFQDWPRELAARFGRWLNHKLDSDKLNLAEAEFSFWWRELAHDLDWQGQLDSTLRAQDTRLHPGTAQTEAKHEPA